MANQKRGRQSFVLAQPPVITAWANVAGKKEVEGPLAHTLMSNAGTPISARKPGSRPKSRCSSWLYGSWRKKPV